MVTGDNPSKKTFHCKVFYMLNSSSAALLLSNQIVNNMSSVPKRNQRLVAIMYISYCSNQISKTYEIF